MRMALMPAARTRRIVGGGAILKGLPSLSPGLAQRRLPWVMSRNPPNPEWVESRPEGGHDRGVAQSVSRDIIHVIFSTKHREPFLQPAALREELHRYLGGILTNLECQPIIVGGAEDHVHLLCVLSRTCTQARLVQETKRASSLWLKTKGPELAGFAWQNGYGVFSLGYSQIEAARK